MDDLKHAFLVVGHKKDECYLLGGIRHDPIGVSDVIKASYRLLKIFSNPTNRLALEYEIRYAITCTEYPYWGWFAKYCPFLLTCLTAGCSFNEDDFSQGTEQVEDNDNLRFSYEEPFGRSCTIFDLTDLDNIAYCFMNLGFRFPVTTPPERSMPVSMEAWLVQQCDSKEDEMSTLKTFEPTLDLFREVPLNGLASLEVGLSAAFPWVYPQNEGFDGLPGLNLAHTLELFERSTPKTLSSMRACTMEKVIDALMGMSIREIDTVLGQCEHLIDMGQMIFKRFVDSPTLLSSVPNGVALLGRALRKARTIDLSSFPGLSTNELSQILLEIPTVFERTSTISLSGNEFIGYDIWLAIEIINAYPNLSTLHLANVTSNEDAIKSVRQHKPTLRVYDSFPYHKVLDYGEGHLWRVRFLPEYLPNDRKTRPPFPNTPRISQIVLAIPGETSYQHLVGATYAHGFEVDGANWKGTVCVYSFDTVAQTTPVFQGMVRFLEYLSNRLNDLSWSGSTLDSWELTDALARSLALVTHASSQDSEFTAHPIPGDSEYRTDLTVPQSYIPGARALTRNDWTCLITLKNTPVENVEYAFVTRGSTVKAKKSKDRSLHMGNYQDFIQNFVQGQDAEDKKSEMLEIWRQAFEGPGCPGPTFSELEDVKVMMEAAYVAQGLK